MFGCTASAPAIAVGPMHTGSILVPDLPARPYLQLVQSTGLEMISDAATGVRLGVPKGLTMTPKKAGTNWESSDRRFSVDSLLFTDRTLDALYETMRTREGRTIKRAEKTATSFLLEGNDGAKTWFHIQAHVRGTEIRALSVVHSDTARRELVQMVPAIVNSFVPFAVPVMTGTLSNAEIAKPNVAVTNEPVLVPAWTRRRGSN